MDHHRGEAQQGVQSQAFGGRRAGGGEGVCVEDHQRDEEPAEAEQDRGRVGGDLAQALAREEQREARPQREQPGPQQQGAFLRGPHRGGAVEQRGGAAGGVGDGVEGEVVAQEGDLEHQHRHGEQTGERVHRASPRERELGPPAARPVDGDRDAIRAHDQREHEADVSEERHQPLPPPTARLESPVGVDLPAWPTVGCAVQDTSSVLLLRGWGGLVLGGALGDEGVAFADVPIALLLHGDDDLAPFAEGIGDDAGVGNRDRG